MLCNNHEHFSIRLWHVTKSGILYDNWQQPAQWLDREEAPKHFSKPNLHQKKGHGPCLEICWWFDPAFWMPVKPWHLRSSLNTSMRCTKTYNACGNGQEKGPNSSPHLTAHHTTNASKAEQIGLWSFASLAILTWPLVNWLPLLQASWQLFAGKMLPRWAGGRKCFPIICQIPKHGFLCYRDKQTFLVGKNVLTVMVPILINKDVFESSYNDNWNCNCFFTSLIHELTPRICSPDLKELKIQQNFDQTLYREVIGEKRALSSRGEGEVYHFYLFNKCFTNDI